MSKPRVRVPVPHFRAALASRPEALEGIAKNTASRWRQGEFPRIVRWLVENPELLDALRADAENLKADDVSQIAA
jgi:hypothetical protein